MLSRGQVQPASRKLQRYTGGGGGSGGSGGRVPPQRPRALSRPARPRTRGSATHRASRSSSP
ncbi:hypothetical protein ACRRTK_015284 [Alexandromys fortis]